VSEELLRFGEATIRILASAETTGGALGLFEELAPLLDTPMHVHSKEDELFYSLEGEHVIQVGEEEHRIGPNESVFGPRGVPHSQGRVVPGEGRLLVLVVPGGFEGFFRGLAEADAAGRLGPKAYAELSAQYGITWL